MRKRRRWRGWSRRRGLDPTVYGDYDVSTQYNIEGLVRMEGLEVNRALTPAEIATLWDESGIGKDSVRQNP